MKISNNDLLRTSRMALVSMMCATLAVGALAGPANAVDYQYSVDSEIFIGSHNYGTDVDPIDETRCDLKGAGTAVSPYDVNSALALAEVNDCSSNAVSDGEYKFYNQSANIDLTPSNATPWNELDVEGFGGWTPIGDYSIYPGFTGDFNGNGFVISNLTINRSESGQGLFGWVVKSNLHNISLLSSTVTSGGNDVGILASYIDNSDISNISLLSSTLTSEGIDVGILAGYVYGTNISDVTIGSAAGQGAQIDSFVNAEGTKYGQYMGGMVGWAQESNATNVKVNAVVENKKTSNDVDDNNVYDIGGIFGYLKSGNVSNASFTGNVYGDSRTEDSFGKEIGGVVGWSEFVTFSDIGASGTVTGSFRLGGLVGSLSSSSVKDGSFVGEIIASSGPVSERAKDIGGAFGDAYYGGASNISVNAKVLFNSSEDSEFFKSIGGVAGNLEYFHLDGASFKGKIECVGVPNDSDEVDDSSEVGGIAGHLWYGGKISNTTVEANVTTSGGEKVGGIIGYSYYGASVSDSSYSGKISATQDNVGGLVGYAQAGVAILRSSVESGSSVTSSGNNVGGVIGYARSDAVKAIDSYSRAVVEGANFVGGVVGAKHVDVLLKIKNVYSTGTVTATGIVVANGALAVDAFATAAMYEAPDKTNAYDATTSGQATSGSGVTGYTTAQMKDAATFNAIGWKLDTEGSPWSISASVNDGYPNLDGPAVVVPVVAPVAAPAAAPAAAVVAKVEVGKISFAAGSSVLSKSAKKSLRATAVALKAGGFKNVTVRVYTTSNKTNLSLIRAQVVASYLKKQGIKVTIKKQAALTKSKKLNNRARIYGNNS